MISIPKRLIDILSTDEFLVSILEAAKLSGNNESSFRVHGNRKFYETNEPMEEESTSCLTGIGAHGVVYHVKGSGLYLPKKASSIIDVHFHPKDSVAMPSIGDLNSTFSDYLGNRSKAFLEDSVDFKYLVPTSVVGFSSKKSIDLFFYQPFNIDIDSFDPNFHHENFDSKFRDKDGRLALSDKTLSSRSANELENTGKYLAEAFSFSGKKDYLNKIGKLKRFNLTEEMKFEDPVDTPTPIKGPTCSDDMFDAEEELRRLSFS